jgi:hypothetical protein
MQPEYELVVNHILTMQRCRRWFFFLIHDILSFRFTKNPQVYSNNLCWYIFSSNHLCWVAQEVLHQLLTDRNSSSHLTFQIQCTSQYFQATSTEQIITREKGKWQVSRSKLTNLSNSFGSSVLHHVFPFRLQPSTRFQKWSPKNPWNQPHFPWFQAQLNLIHQKKKKHDDKQIRKKIKSNSDVLRL